MFVAMGLSAVAPVVHGLTIYGYEQLNKQMGLDWMLLQGLLYITGAGLYAVSRQQIHNTIERKAVLIQRIGSGTGTTCSWSI